MPREAVIRMNVPVLPFSLGAAMITALLFGLAPALLTAKLNVAELPLTGVDSMRQTASMVRCRSVVDAATDHQLWMRQCNWGYFLYFFTA